MLNTILSFPEFPEFPGYDPNGSFDPNASYPLNLVANASYVITRDHCLGDSDLQIPPNVTLYFMGGKILPHPLSDPNTSYSDGSILIGNQTKIFAQIEQIFSIDLQVEGTWLIDRAYPQWFGAVGYFEPIPDTSVDSADAINKAIKMKQTGEVFIPRGYYKIGKTILVKYGINLLGECGGHLIKNEITNTYDPETCGTLLHSTGSITNYYGGYFMMINILNPTSSTTQSNAKWEVGYPNPGTSVKNIFFSNSSPNVGNLKGILVAGNFELDCLYWFFYRQAVACVLTAENTYSDQKKITNCTFDFPSGSNQDLYAFDVSGLGDALMFEHNGIHQAINKKGVKFNTCNGGAITSNVINADVLIQGCKAITFNSNHMEGGAQLMIMNSNINLSNNYLWKYERPSIVIKSPGLGEISVVSSSGNLFLFYDIPTGVEGTPWDITKVCEYDIQIDAVSLLQIEQSYRYFVVSAIISKMVTHGVLLCKEENGVLSPIDSFNQFSYLLSTSSSIMSYMHVNNNSFIGTLDKPVLEFIGPASMIKWTKPTGSYSYKSHCVWDLDRRIIGNVRVQGSRTLTNGGQGLMLVMHGVYDEGGCQVCMRIYRGLNGNYTEYVDVPICGTQYLYDNGTSICGFKWKAMGTVLTGNTNVQSIAYKGKNIECRALAAPTSGTWQEGDIVYNTNRSVNTALWIYLSGSWVGR